MKKYLYILLSTLFLVACGGNKTDKEKARNEYGNALNDSIKTAEDQIEEANSRIAVLNDEVNTWMRDFTVVNNTREVEGYYIFNGWQKRYPLSTTGLVARIAENEQLELIASLKGATFNRIEVMAPTSSVGSDIVPFDQALNYRRESLNTVMFSGAKADSIAQLIADNELNTVKVVFFEGNSTKGNWQIPEDYKKMIMSTWMLYSSRHEQMKLEHKVVMLREKINLLRAHLHNMTDPEPTTDSAK